MTNPTWRRYELLADLEDAAADSLVKQGIGKDAARRVSQKLALMLMNNWGGQLINFPSGFAAKISARDDEILARWAGASPADLACEFGISLRATYKARKRALARHAEAESKP